MALVPCACLSNVSGDGKRSRYTSGRIGQNGRTCRRSCGMIETMAHWSVDLIRKRMEMRWRFLAAFGHAFHLMWPVLSALLVVQLAMGLLIGFVEGWSPGDAVYFTFVTGLTIGYGDLFPRQALTRVLAIGIGLCGLLTTGLKRQLRHTRNAPRWRE
jgi:Ion channel